MESRFKIEQDYLYGGFKIFVDGKCVIKVENEDSVNKLLDVLRQVYNIGFAHGKSCLDYPQE